MTWTAVRRLHRPLSEVRVEHVASTRLVDPGVEALLDRTWAAQQADAEARGRLLTDAPAYRLEGLDVHADEVVLRLALVDYRVHSALKQVHAQVAPDHRDRVLVPDALVRTRDDRVVLLRTDKPTGNELQLVGGTATPGQREIHGAADLADFVRLRVSGALPGCGAVEVRGLLGAVTQEIGCVSLVVDVRLDVAAADLAPGEGHELVLLDVARLAAWLRRAPGYLPAVEGVL